MGNNVEIDRELLYRIKKCLDDRHTMWLDRGVVDVDTYEIVVKLDEVIANNKAVEQA